MSGPQNPEVPKIFGPLKLVPGGDPPEGGDSNSNGGGTSVTPAPERVGIPKRKKKKVSLPG